MMTAALNQQKNETGQRKTFRKADARNPITKSNFGDRILSQYSTERDETASQKLENGENYARNNKGEEKCRQTGLKPITEKLSSTSM